MEARSYQLRKIDRGFKPRIIIASKELGIKFWVAGEDEARVYPHKDLEELDEFIKDSAPDSLDISCDPNYGLRNKASTQRGGSSAQRGRSGRGGRGIGHARMRGASSR